VRQLSARVAGADPAATALAVGHLTKRPINQAAIIRNGGQPNKGSIMLLLWTFVVIGEVSILVAGAQAVRLMRDRDSRISWLQTQIGTVQAESDTKQKQLDAQKILLQQAEAWLEMERQKLNQPPSPTSAHEPAQ
jgi:hypothetical protein